MTQMTLSTFGSTPARDSNCSVPSPQFSVCKGRGGSSPESTPADSLGPMGFELQAATEKALREHARLAWPQEACGLLAAGTDGVQRYLPMANTANARTRFEMDPVEFARRERELREAGLWICGFFHSHPHGPARPSPADIAAAWPQHVQLILGMRDQELAAWHPGPDEDGELQRVPISAT